MALCKVFRYAEAPEPRVHLSRNLLPSGRGRALHCAPGSTSGLAPSRGYRAHRVCGDRGLPCSESPDCQPLQPPVRCPPQPLVCRHLQSSPSPVRIKHYSQFSARNLNRKASCCLLRQRLLGRGPNGLPTFVRPRRATRVGTPASYHPPDESRSQGLPWFEILPVEIYAQVLVEPLVVWLEELLQPLPGSRGHRSKSPSVTLLGGRSDVRVALR